MNTELMTAIAISVLIIIAVMLIFRQINCWYWKINKRVELQQESIEIQKKILELLKKIS